MHTYIHVHIIIGTYIHTYMHANNGMCNASHTCPLTSHRAICVCKRMHLVCKNACMCVCMYVSIQERIRGGGGKSV